MCKYIVWSLNSETTSKIHSTPIEVLRAVHRLVCRATLPLDLTCSASGGSGGRVTSGGFGTPADSSARVVARGRVSSC